MSLCKQFCCDSFLVILFYMACWYFDKKDLRNTPSTIDNIDYATEHKYRQEGARFIISAGTKMDLGYNTIATGVVFFHRFYMFHSFREFPQYMTGCCCLFLAGKVEETPKKARDIISTALSILSEEDFAALGKNPRDELMVMEKILLQTIKFDFQVEHPYQYLLKYAKCLKGDKAKLQKMVQMAWTFVNDSLCTTLSLQWEPEVIAIALMYLAGKLSKFEVIDWTGRTPSHLFWWDQYVEDVTISHLDDICHQVLDLYSSPPKTAKSPAVPRRTPPKKIAVISSAVPSAAVVPVTPIHVPNDSLPISAKVVNTPVVEPRLPIEDVQLPLDLPPPPPLPPMMAVNYPGGPPPPSATYNALGYPPVFPPVYYPSHS